MKKVFGILYLIAGFALLWIGIWQMPFMIDSGSYAPFLWATLIISCSTIEFVASYKMFTTKWNKENKR